MNRKPIVGITCNYNYPSELFGVSHPATGTRSSHSVAADFINAIEKAGGIPVIIPARADESMIDEFYELCDAFLFTGGVDVDSRLYGERLRKCGSLTPLRDNFEIYLIRKLYDDGTKPVLGICRGCQIINVALGGSLYQDLKSEGYEEHSIMMLPRNYPTHSVKLNEGSKLYEIFGTDTIEVNSYHHQAMNRIADNADCAALSEDGVREAIELEGKKFFIGVQWHPEMMFDSELQSKLFSAFVEAAK